MRQQSNIWEWVDGTYANSYNKWSSSSSYDSQSGDYATLYYYSGIWSGHSSGSYSNSYPFVCGTSIDSSNSDSNTVNAVGLGLGLGFGLGIPFIIVICCIGYFCFFRKRKKPDDFLELPGM